MKRTDLTIVQREVTTRGTVHNSDLVLADLSGSMSEPAFEGHSKYDCLKTALAVIGSNPKVQILGFNYAVYEVQASELPKPAGGTQLHLALQKAGSLEPLHVLVICDGRPDSTESAMLQGTLVAEQCIIDTLFIGPASDEEGIAFMKKLAQVGRGRYSSFDPVQGSPLLLGEKVASLLLTGPAATIQL